MPTLDPELTARFQADLDRLAPAGRLGLAVSGGPDSLALLLLAAAVRPGEVEVATVDHGLRSESVAEATMVAAICAGLGIRHQTLPVAVTEGASLQARAREARYVALGGWSQRQGLAAVATAHHRDDQAETLLMRLTRGAGLSGLAAVRARRPLADGVELIRPLLAWRKRELAAIVQAAGLNPADDPANADPRFDRTRVRALLEQVPMLDPERLAASAAHLAEAEDALAYAAAKLFGERMRRADEAITLAAGDLPRELQRRLLLLAIDELGDAPPRGTDLDRALAALAQGGTCTLGSLKLQADGGYWLVSSAPPRVSALRPGP